MYTRLKIDFYHSCDEGYKSLGLRYEMVRDDCIHVQWMSRITTINFSHAGNIREIIQQLIQCYYFIPYSWDRNTQYAYKWLNNWTVGKAFRNE